MFRRRVGDLLSYNELSEGGIGIDVADIVIVPENDGDRPLA